MSEEKQYVEVTLRVPGGKDINDALEKRGEVICELLSKSEYSDDFKNDDIIINYDTPGELYVAISTDTLTNDKNYSDFYGILLGGLAGLDDEVL